MIQDKYLEVKLLALGYVCIQLDILPIFYHVIIPIYLSSMYESYHYLCILINNCCVSVFVILVILIEVSTTLYCCFHFFKYLFIIYLAAPGF